MRFEEIELGLSRPCDEPLFLLRDKKRGEKKRAPMIPRLSEIEWKPFDFKRVPSLLAPSGQPSRGILPRSGWLAIPGFARALRARPFPAGAARLGVVHGVFKSVSEFCWIY
ncbi:MAG: hypothetical protein ACRESA_00335 [Gammaproteobacteria bacterium]